MIFTDVFILIVSLAYYDRYEYVFPECRLRHLYRLTPGLSLNPQALRHWRRTDRDGLRGVCSGDIWAGSVQSSTVQKLSGDSQNL